MPTPIERSQAILAHKQVEAATRQLKTLMGQQPRPDEILHKISACVELGALSDSLPLADWRETLQEDNHLILAVLLRGSEDMSTNQQINLGTMAASYNAKKCMPLLLARAKESYYLRAQPEILQAAVNADWVDMARMLIGEGAAIDMTSTIRSPHGVIGWVKSAPMLDLLVENGAKPTYHAMVHTCLGDIPYPALLERFLHHGTPLHPTDPVARTAWEKVLLYRKDSGVFQGEYSQCARLLLDAGLEIPANIPYDLPAMATLVRAGCDAQVVLAHALRVARGQLLIKEGVVGPTHWAEEERSKLVEQMLVEVADAGMDIDMLWAQCKGLSLARAFVRAGAEIQEPGNMTTDQDRAAGQARRLARTTHYATSSKTGPRL